MSFTPALDNSGFDNLMVRPIEWQAVSFALALVLYALTGSPTPDHIGVTEILTGALLLISVSVPVITSMPVPAALLVIYGFSVPLIVGVASGHAGGAVVRDLIPFGFLLMPLLFRATPFLPWLVAGVGMAFAVRSLIPYKDTFQHPHLWLGQPPADLLYLANSPEVLFTALFLLGSGLLLVWNRRSLAGGLALTLAAAFPMMAMAVMMQRAGIGCVILAGMVWAAIAFWVRPGRTLLTAAAVCCLLLPFIPLIEALLGTLVLKTELVGLNSRAQEWGRVIELVSQSPWTLLFGLGWGLTFENPAVGNIEVNYTHSLISAMLLKTGLAGVGLMLLYLWILVKQSVPQLFRRPILVLALLCPLGIGLLFYASYKSLGFGLILLLLANPVFYRKLEKNQ